MTQPDTPKVLTHEKEEPLPATPRLFSEAWGPRGLWQLRLRWAVPPVIVVGAALSTALGFTVHMVGIVSVAAVVLAYNAVLCLAYVRIGRQSDPEAERILAQGQVWLDYGAMFVLCYLTGGPQSPLQFFFVFHVSTAAVRFRPRTVFGFAGMAVGGMGAMVAASHSGILGPVAVLFAGEPLWMTTSVAHSLVALFFLAAILFGVAALTTRLMERLREQVGLLSQASRRIQQMSVERQQFFFQVVHNIRSPLAASDSMLDLVRGGHLGDLNEEQQDFLGRIARRLAGLNNAVGDILKAARQHRGRIARPTCPTSPQEVVMAVVERVRERASQKGLRLCLDVPESFPRVVMEEGLLEEITENLTSNAIQYTHEGHIDIHLRWADGDTLVLVIRDTGVGIPEQDRGKLFGQFYRASNARRHYEDGMGLGLYVTKQAVERCGGRIELASRDSGGTTVTVELKPSLAEVG